jgi:hypothetical protein
MTCLVTLESWQPRKATLGSSRADTVGPALTLPLFGQSRIPRLANDMLLSIAQNLRLLLDECVVAENHGRS